MEYPKYYINTDTVDIDNKQIGISSGRKNRELCVGVNHLGTKQSVSDATKVAKLFAAAPEMLNALEHCVAYFEKYKPKFCGVGDDRDCSPYNDAFELINSLKG